MWVWVYIGVHIRNASILCECFRPPRMLSTAILLMLWATSVAACSLLVSDSTTISRIGQNPEQGTNRVRLGFTTFQGGMPAQRADGILSTMPGSTYGILHRYDGLMEWFPTIAGYVETANGTFDATTGTATLSFPGQAANSMLTQPFHLPNATYATWFYSARVDYVFIVYTTTFSETRQATCQPSGSCVHSTFSGSSSYVQDTRSGPAPVWDSEGLVQLPLACCLCRSHEHYEFRLQGELSLQAIDALDTSLGVAHYNLAEREIWASRGDFTEFGDLVVTRVRYGQHGSPQSTQFRIQPAQVEAIFGVSSPYVGASDGSLPAWAVGVLAAIGSVVATAGIVILVCSLYRRPSRMVDPRRTQSKANTDQLHATTTTTKSAGCQVKDIKHSTSKMRQLPTVSAQQVEAGVEL